VRVLGIGFSTGTVVIHRSKIVLAPSWHGLEAGYVISTRKSLLADGYTPALLKKSLRDGDLVRLRRGVYEQRTPLASEPEAQHRRQIVASTLLSGYVVSHASAVVLHGLPIGDADIHEVHVSRIGPGRGGDRHRAGRQVHVARLEPEFCTTVDGIPVTTVARSLVDLARTAGRRTAVSAGDAALHGKLCTAEDLAQALEVVRGRPGADQARWSLALCDARSESPGETWTRLLLREAGLPSTDLQISVFDESGRFVGCADGGIPQWGVLWEYDGVAKYDTLLKPGQTALDAVLAEKRREGRFVELGWLVIRVINTDLRPPGPLVRRFSEAAARTRRPGWQPPRGWYRIASPSGPARTTLRASAQPV
jgi:hypothetical protein